MARDRRSPLFLGGLTGILAGAALTACVPIFLDGLAQSLDLTFRLDKAIVEGEETVVHSAFFPEGFKLKKNHVRVAGRLQASDGDDLPSQVTVRAESNDENGRTGLKLSIKLNIRDDGTFSGSTKLKKNVAAGDLMTITLEPFGGDLTRNTELDLCVDVVKKKSDLNQLADCVTVDADLPEATLSSLQADHFTPTCARSGCHSTASASAGLVLVAGQTHGNLVNVPSTQGQNLVTPNDPEGSYLIKKLRGDSDISGQRMPTGGPFLDDVELDRFVGWINNGAPNN